MTFHIKACRIDDIPAILELALDVHNLHQKNRSDEFRRINAADLERFYLSALDDEKHIFLTCLLNKKVAGYILIRIIHRKENPFQKELRFAYLDQISVKREYQRMGAGNELIEASKKILIKNKIRILKLDVWNFNQNARNFFISRGFKPRVEQLEMKL